MDPLSIVAGGAGFVSLGLTVTKGLTTFCRDFRSQDDDIANLANNSEKLQECVIMTKKRLEIGSETDGDVKSSLQDCIKACDACIHNVQDIFKTESLGPKGQGKSLVRRLSFPFRKERLEALRSQIVELRSALSTQLILLSL